MFNLLPFSQSDCWGKYVRAQTIQGHSTEHTMTASMIKWPQIPYPALKSVTLTRHTCFCWNVLSLTMPCAMPPTFVCPLHLRQPPQHQQFSSSYLSKNSKLAKAMMSSKVGENLPQSAVKV